MQNPSLFSGLFNSRRSPMAGGPPATEVPFRKRHPLARLGHSERTGRLANRTTSRATLASDSRGFALTLFVAALPVLLSFFFLLFATHQLDHRVRRARTACITQLWETQTRVAGVYNRLWKLNPQALSLRAQKIRLLSSIAVAASTGHLVAVIALRAQLAQVESSQLLLTSRQQVLLSEARRLLFSGQNRTRSELLRQTGEFGTQSVPLPTPFRVAVYPDSPDLAPVYVTSARFEDDQTLEQKWLLRWETRHTVSRFLSGRGKGEFSCAVSIERVLGAFRPVLREGKR